MHTSCNEDKMRSSSRLKRTTGSDTASLTVMESPVEITWKNKPVESGIRTKNLVLILKIIRATVSRLTPDSQQLQINELDRCWQNDMPFLDRSLSRKNEYCESRRTC